MGEKGNDGGQFFTPRQIIRVMVRVAAPKIGETVDDPGCGTCGFLAKGEAIEDAVYDLKAVNPNRATDEDTRTPAELLDFIADKGREADAALARLGNLVAQAAPVLPAFLTAATG
jgi:hypothetical protein